MATTRTHFRVQEPAANSGHGENVNKLYDIVNNGLIMGMAEFLAMIILLTLLSYWS